MFSFFVCPSVFGISFQFVVVRRAEQRRLHFSFVLFLVWVAKAGAPPVVVVLFSFMQFFSCFGTDEKFKANNVSFSFLFIFVSLGLSRWRFPWEACFTSAASFCCSGPCEKGRKSEEKVDFRMNVVSAASSKGSLSNLSAFLCFRQCSLQKNSLRAAASARKLQVHRLFAGRFLGGLFRYFRGPNFGTAWRSAPARQNPGHLQFGVPCPGEVGSLCAKCFFLRQAV
jgi:hypothetical protein